ncbi:MAG: hypothetical protein K0Q55_1228 [Verrucomicrobia bacterium]|jgi:uncharacterized protein YjeT (DUF2065 family)|nr:hypothetical protein [Verrucomicrobiota bacterium]
MKRFSGAEIAMLVVASVFIVVGAMATCAPAGRRMAILPAPKWPSNRSESVTMSKNQVRGLGVTAVLFGIGLIWMTLQKPEEK